MTTEYQPLIASDTGAGSATTKCQPSNRGTEPTLAEMTDKAIKLLQGNTKGFVLQVEGASIDKRDHASDACGQIGELIGMDDAIGIAQEFQRTHPDTLIVVSADHSHTSQIIGPTTVPAWPVHDAADRRRRPDPHRLRHRSDRRLAVPYGRDRPGVRLGPSRRRRRRARSTRPRCSRSSPTRRPAAVPPPPTPVGGDIGGAVPATLALNVGGPAAFPAFAPGVARDYTAGLTANVISTAGVATLSVADGSTNVPGRLVNGAFSLATPLQARAKDGAFASVGAGALDLLTYNGPVSNDAVPLEFKQSIAANEASAHGHVRQDAHPDALHHHPVARRIRRRSAPRGPATSGNVPTPDDRAQGPSAPCR